MRKKTAKDPIIESMTRIHEQLAVMDNKLDAFMTKSLKELAEAMAVVKSVPRPPAPAPGAPRVFERPGRTLYTVICFECGKDCQIPFKPTANRPVYCRECFAKRKSAQQKGSTPGVQTVSLSGARRITTVTASAPKRSARSRSKTAAKRPAAKRKTAKAKAARKTTKKKSTGKKSAKRKSARRK